MKHFYLIFFFMLLPCQLLLAVENQELAMGMGMAMVSLTENPKSLEGTNITEPEGGSISAISSNLYWKFLPRDRYSFYLNTSIPILPASGTSYFYFGSGFEYYFSALGHKVQENSFNLKLTMSPKLRYLVFAELGVSYLAYVTETAQKSDVSFELGGGGGLAYAFGPRWGIKAQGAFMRGVGILTSSFAIKAFFSATYFISN